ncbi:MAG: RNA polymerase sigma factor [Planctomycetota bacterium]|jgi:RNA polymerase sigma-70 factor (ECF subfamily)
MDSTQDYRELVGKARQGDQEALKGLCEVATSYLRAYVYRLTLRHDLTQDVVQEAVIEMVKFLEQLESTDKFRPWLRKIADNKLFHRQKHEQRNKTVSISEGASAQLHSPGDEGFAHLVADEIKQIVLESMAALDPLHRKVLVLRCYEQLKYRDIADQMGRSQFAVRMMFTRAKRSLARNLTRRGLGKGSLLIALVLFGRITAQSKAAAATVSAVAPTLKTGIAAGAVATLAGKTGVVTLSAAGLLAVGTMVATSGPEGTTTAISQGTAQTLPPVLSSSGATEECWHYFPQGADGPVMMRQVQSDPKSGWSKCTWLQNEQANFVFDNGRTFMRNARMWHKDLSVWRLPTDEPKLTDFLSQIESRPDELGYTPLRGEGLLIVARSQVAENGNDLLVVRRSHVLEKEYFRHVGGAKVVDNRDAMHKRGWTYFRIEGRIDGDRVSGTGRIPFVYAAGIDHYPWLKLNIADRLEMIDDGKQAIMRQARKVLASYEAGSFFAGLSRPWMGLHTIDTVRRDAAERQVPFETSLDREGEKAEVVLSTGQDKLVYTINMKDDVVERIRISTGQGLQAELVFSYLEDIDRAGYEFTEPQITRRYGSLQRKSPGILWLLQILAHP